MDPPRFSTNVPFFLTQDPIQNPTWHLFVISFSLFCPQSFLVFDDLDNFEVYYSDIFRMSLKLGYSVIFSWLPGYIDCWEEYHRNDVPFSWHHIKQYKISICLITSHVNLDHLRMVGSAKFLHHYCFSCSILYWLKASY